MFSAKLVTCLCVAAVFATSSVQAAGPDPLLKGIDSVTYVAGIYGDNECALDHNELETSLRFVANQSAKLKLISFGDFTDKANALFADARATLLGTQGSDLADERARRYYNMPHLIFVGESHIVQGSCFISIEAEVRAATSPAKLIVNDAPAPAPGVVLWRNSYWLTGPKYQFSSRVIGIAERLMKEFVNDWSASQ
jgi:hypothetical protein